LVLLVSVVAACTASGAPSTVVSAGTGTSSSPTPSASGAPSATPATFPEAEALLRAGYVTDAGAIAEAALKAALQTNPAATLPPDLRNLPGQAGPISLGISAVIGQQWWAGLGEFWAGLGAFLPLLGSLLAVAMLIVLFVRTWLHGPRVQMGTLDDSASSSHGGPALGGLIAAELAQMREEGAGPALNVVSGADAALSDLLPAPVATSLPGIQLLAALADLVGPRRVQLSGQVGPDAGTFGKHLSLELTERYGAAQAISLDARDFSGLPRPDAQSPLPAPSPPEGEAMTLLGLAGAAWVAYQSIRSKDPTKWKRLPTSDWRSYALTRTGAALYEAGQRDRARQLYTDALVLDRNNRAALFNLGVLDQHECPRHAVARLEHALKLVDEAATTLSNEPKDRLWYRVRYNLAASMYGVSHSSWLELRTMADRAVEVVTAAIGRCAERGPSGPKPDEISFLQMTMQTTLVLLAAVLWRLEECPVKPVAGDDGVSVEEQRLREYFGALEPRVAFTPGGIIGWVTRLGSLGFLPPRVEYNLACYYTESWVAEPADRLSYDKAWASLESAVVDRRLVTSAEHDRLLEPLLNSGKTTWARIKVGSAASDITYAGPTTAAPGALIPLSATLKTGSGAAMAGRTLSFTLNGIILNATTDSLGAASVKMIAPANAGSYPVDVALTGDTTYTAAAISATLTVR